ncbi:MAG TPA: hypothetical protein VGN38_00895 [Caulobacteraceae bacterium]|jgi:hypothetical protein|nr:hypothetical protein [Caulobacteraceae bacterium]
MARGRARPTSRKSFAAAKDEAERRQRAYAAHRRAWAEAVGRPYLRQEDPRPPPGELDVDAAEE